MTVSPQYPVIGCVHPALTSHILTRQLLLNALVGSTERFIEFPCRKRRAVARRGIVSQPTREAVVPGAAALPHDDRNSMPSPPGPPDPVGPAAADNRFAREDAGYHHDLSNRQMQMIAIGGAIGTGLFMGAGARLASAGPGLFLIYWICGAFVFLILRALGELVLHRPASGSFVSYAREFFGEKAAFVAGWMYFLNWAMAAIVDSTAIASYFHYWTAFQAVPQWTLALVALAAVVSVNLISVKAFGEFEFWAALIKVIALTTFLVVGIVFLAGRFKIEGKTTGPHIWADHGGFLPTGLLPLVLVTSGVIFAYAAVELVGTAAGGTADPEKVVPRGGKQVGARPDRGILLRLSAFACTATPLHHLQAWREPVRHILLPYRFQWRG